MIPKILQEHINTAAFENTCLIGSVLPALLVGQPPRPVIERLVPRQEITFGKRPGGEFDDGPGRSKRRWKRRLTHPDERRAPFRGATR